MEVKLISIYMDKIRKVSQLALVVFLSVSLAILLLALSKPTFFRDVIGGVSLVGLIAIFWLSKRHSFFWNQLEMSAKLEESERRWAWVRYLMSFCLPQLIFGALFWWMILTRHF